MEGSGRTGRTIREEKGVIRPECIAGNNISVGGLEWSIGG